MIKNVLVSVSDKSGLLEFIKPLTLAGARIVSTGGTAKYLRENGITIVDVSEQTHFPEVMGGRVKTLHPMVHMGLLARMDNPEDLETLKKFSVEIFDLVIVNLYPFEDAVKSGATGSALIEKIDVGGPSMLRAAAKNHGSIAVICDPKDYLWISQNNYEIPIEDRRLLAAKVFQHTSAYDSLIAQELSKNVNLDRQKLLQETQIFSGRLVQELRYGENPHQKAAWYGSPGENSGLNSAQIIQGKELSFNNILDLDAAVSLLQNLNSAACVAVKHNNPCGAGNDPLLITALKKCLSADPVSVFGGIVAINQEITEVEANLLSEVFLECIIAPKISDAAKQVFAKKKNLRILEWPQINFYSKKHEIKTVLGGFVIQDTDTFGNSKNWNFLGHKPSTQIEIDLEFGERVCGALKSNSIAIVKDGQTLGLGMGQVNRVDAVEQAIQRMNKFHPQVLDPVLISDAFFPFPDSIEIAAKAGIKWILQPGGSVKDQEVFAAAEKLGVNIIVSGQRHFRH